MKRSLRAMMFASVAWMAVPAALAQDEAGFLVPATPRADLDVRIVFLPERRDALETPPPEGAERLSITGTYTSAEQPIPVGFVLRDGLATTRQPGGPDGLLLIDADGRASIHDISRVAWSGAVYNLRDSGENAPFLEIAAAQRLTAIQTHLLINDGALDLRDIAGAPRFRRRLLFETQDGELGVYDTGARMMTLYDAAVALQEAAWPRMALNLDMGTFDFCERLSANGVERCGYLRRSGLDKLTNVITITRLVDR